MRPRRWHWPATPKADQINPVAYGPTPIGKRRIKVTRRAMNDGWAAIGQELERRHLTRHDGVPWAPRRKNGKYKGCLVQETMQRGLYHYLKHVEEKGEPKGFTKATAYLEAQRIVNQILGDRDAPAVDPNATPVTPLVSS